MACVSRMFGLPPGRHPSIRWEAFDIDGGNFPTGSAPRPRPSARSSFRSARDAPPDLRDWWERAGRRQRDDVLPSARLSRPGRSAAFQPREGSEACSGGALGFQAPVRTPIERRNGRDHVRVTWVEGESETPGSGSYSKNRVHPARTFTRSTGRETSPGDAGVELTQAIAPPGANDVKASISGSLADASKRCDSYPQLHFRSPASKVEPQ